MENQKRSINWRFFIVPILFLSVWGGCYFMMDTPDCIRMIPDASVKCECDFSSRDDWQKFKEDTHGAWEQVEVEGEPCKK